MLGLPRGVDWRGVKGIRDVMAHDYLGIEIDVLDDVVADYLPGLRAECRGFETRLPLHFP